jgi:alpha,alpha-trehalose-phosphate synthase [UDP-forming]
VKFNKPQKAGRKNLSGPDTKKRRRLLVVSNRSPYYLESTGGTIRMVRNVSGMVTGLEPVLSSTKGMWIAWGTVPENCSADIYRIPPSNPTFDLKLIPLDFDELKHFYMGFSNSTLWPLAHNFLGRTAYLEEDWRVYVAVNQKFAAAVAQEAKPSDLIWVNDYHLALVPMMLRSMRVRSKIGFFWHIPFPPLDLFRTLPWRKELLEGLIKADLIGFHCRSYVQNFLHGVEDILKKDVSFGKGLIRNKRTVKVGAFPMGVDYAGIQELVAKKEILEASKRLRQDIGADHIVLSVDRLDYSKGIPERLNAVERFLEENPRYLGRISFVQISVPSRIQIPEYYRMRREVENAVGRINGRFARADWTPVYYYFRALPFEELVTYYLAADICFVTPLRDGMNLIAKEYAAAQDPQKGMLVLSEFAGAAEELKESVIVNPYSIPSLVRGLKEALEIKVAERRTRMSQMRKRLRRKTVEKWGRTFLDRLKESSYDGKRIRRKKV